MSWFDNWLENKAIQVLKKREANAVYEVSKMSIAKAGVAMAPQTLGHRLETSGIRFNLYKATGGFVVETQSYDNRTDRHQTHLYVINKEQDLGNELGKIITLEALKS